MRIKKMEKITHFDKIVMLEISRNKEETYKSDIARNIDGTYSHVVKVLSRLKKKGLVDFDKQGRMVKIHMTKKGQEFVDAVQKMFNIWGIKPNDIRRI